MTYTNINGYFVPNLILPEPVKQFSRYGQLRAKYLEEHRPLLHDKLLLEGTLNRHLAEVDAAAHQAVEDYIFQAAKRQSVTEAMKEANPLEWARRMNAIKSAAEEAVLPDILYPEEQK